VEFDDQFKLGHLLFSERKCRVCGEVKDLIDGFYLIRKNRKNLVSSYSYECKICTVRRIVENRRKNHLYKEYEYPDW
jgi:hypothetical protein